MSDVMSDAVTVTICGAPTRETLAALLDVAVHAGLGFILQPRQIAPAPLLLPPGPVVESRRVKAPRRGHVVAKAAPVARRKVGRPLAVAPEALLVALRAGPMSIGDIERKLGVSRFRLAKFVAAGSVVASGSTVNRRISLPTKAGPAKEVP